MSTRIYNPSNEEIHSRVEEDPREGHICYLGNLRKRIAKITNSKAEVQQARRLLQSGIDLGLEQIELDVYISPYFYCINTTKTQIQESVSH